MNDNIWDNWVDNWNWISTVAKGRNWTIEPIEIKPNIKIADIISIQVN